jgi:DNA replication and repair protein RecF
MMKIESLQIQNLRIIQDMLLQPSGGMNFICGENGAGKTSVLEAIFLLGQGKSFRHADAGPFIRNGESFSLVLAGLQDAQGRNTRLGIQRGRKSFIARHSGKTIQKRSELLRLLPVQLITPQSHELLERGPELRRRYLDFGLFHVEQSYHRFLMSYQRALKQRNSALRSGDGRLANSFNEQLESAAGRIVGYRKNILEDIEEQLQRFLVSMHFRDRVQLQFTQGWKEHAGLASVLRESMQKDMQLGHTGAGPHRSELKILVSGKRAEKHLSRGQQKILVYGLMLALSRLIRERGHEAPVVLIDDLGAELDAGNRDLVLTYLRGMDTQVFITSVEAYGPETLGEAKMFHVEQGVLE